MQINLTTDFGKRVEQRLREETIVWLTTVRRDGTPQPALPSGSCGTTGPS